MMNNLAAKAVATIPEDMESYTRLRRLVGTGQYSKALQSLEESSISQSTKQHLQRVLETKDQYVIDRTFLEIDSRIAQALCWSCWKE